MAVLLATHNPSKFIGEQIKSIAAQSGVRIRIYWGDYGSTDSCKAYVRDLLKDFDFREFKINCSGPAANFFFLLKQTNESYIAFADQDDIWLPSKLINQVNQLLEVGQYPALTHSTSEILLGSKRFERNSICLGHDFASLIFANCCQGCTMMINFDARRILLQSLPKNLVWHDWWIGLVISLTGIILYNRETQVLYRIHENNTIGLPRRILKLKRFLDRPTGNIEYQINEIVERFESVYPQNEKILRVILGCVSKDWKKRFVANLKGPRRRSNLVEEVIHRISWIVKQP